MHTHMPVGIRMSACKTNEIWIMPINGTKVNFLFVTFYYSFLFLFFQDFITREIGETYTGNPLGCFFQLHVNL